MRAKPTLIREKNSQQLFTLFFQKKYKKAEKMVIEILEKSLINYSANKESKENILIYLELLYIDFNKSYLNWLKKNKLQDNNLEKKITSDESDFTYFVNCCSHPEKMQTILWSLGT